jgi:hypothetical protein
MIDIRRNGRKEYGINRVFPSYLVIGKEGWGWKESLEKMPESCGY